jgi:fluoride exporter
VGDEQTKQQAMRRRPMEWFNWLGAAALHPITMVAVGSAIGGSSRYWIGRWIDTRQSPGGMPWGTFTINVTGSLLLGFFAVWFLERLEPARRDIYLLLGTGFCGGYTTFSTFEWEAFKLIRDGNWPTALAYLLGSVIVGFLGVVLGVWTAYQIFGRK